MSDQPESIRKTICIDPAPEAGLLLVLRLTGGRRA